MKLSALTLASICSLAAADEKKVPPRHPLQRLKRLNQFASEILNSDEFALVGKPHKWIQMWENKFATNADRMEWSFERGNQRCGFYDSKM